jgi:hypothetical protein
LANNRLSDLSPLASLESLRVLDISFNAVTSVAFCEDLVNLAVLTASHNSIASVATRLPPFLRELDLAANQLSDLSFLDEHEFLACKTLETLDVSGNRIGDLLSLRCLPALQRLRSASTGLSQKVASAPVLLFAKFVCPSLESFDGEPCAAIEPEFDEGQLLGLLIEGSEQRLRRFLVDSNPSPIVWDAPQFLEFADDDRQSPLGALQSRVLAIEGRIPDEARGGQVGALLSLSPVAKQGMRSMAIPRITARQQ